MAQAVLQVGGDARDVVGELALDDLGRVRVEDERVRVDRTQRQGEGAAQLVDVPSIPTSGWCSATGRKSIWAPSRAPAKEICAISSSRIGIARPLSPSWATALTAIRNDSTWSAI
ncbi:hypothetical protein [Nocardioides daphniae]|uniref:hypothetical protein n=1 Tax=Nocardioides daphniae TaxID=402297 RepID=UPI001EE8FC57|nr:hypothetical protein [Nocardioides daphniae]